MEIVRVLAIGGFGIVYLARDLSLDREIALKEFMPSQLAGRSFGQQVAVRSADDAEIFTLSLRSFVNEAKLLARFSHPAMVKVYRFWEANGTAYMAMPYLRGPTLRDVRRSMSAPPTEAWLRSVTEPLLDALAMLHAEGFYHRDIAPDNVVISGTGRPVLLDFGAARRLIGDRTQSLTAVLKPRYAPIEQYAESTQLRQGPWTDLYALGALIVYLLDGVPPPASTARSIHDEMTPLASRKISGVSTEFLAAVDWALAVRPGDRPQSVAALREALDGGAPRVAPRPEPIATDAPRPAEAESPADSRLSFATTIRWKRPVPTRVRNGTRSIAALASVLIAVIGAWPLVGHAPTAPLPSAVLASQVSAPLSASPPSDAVAALPVKAFDAKPIASTGVAIASTSTVALESAAGALPQIQQARPRTTAAAKPKQKTAHERKLAASRVAVTGPNELCADRNFFIRPFCVQRRCGEPRFKGRAECAPPRQMARSPYD